MRLRLHPLRSSVTQSSEHAGKTLVAGSVDTTTRRAVGVCLTREQSSQIGWPSAGSCDHSPLLVCSGCAGPACLASHRAVLRWMSGRTLATGSGRGRAMNCGAGNGVLVSGETDATLSRRREACPCMRSGHGTAPPGPPTRRPARTSLASTCRPRTGGCCRTFLSVARLLVSMTELTWARDWRDDRRGSRSDTHTLTRDTSRTRIKFECGRIAVSWTDLGRRRLAEISFPVYSSVLSSPRLPPACTFFK